MLATNQQRWMGIIPERWSHLFFIVSILMKAIDGAVQVIAGFVLLIVSPAQIQSFVQAIANIELSEDPADMIANALLKTASHMTPHDKQFAVMFLLGHGIVKLFLVINLLRGKMWAYPLTIVAL